MLKPRFCINDHVVFRYDGLYSNGRIVSIEYKERPLYFDNALLDSVYEVEYEIITEDPNILPLVSCEFIDYKRLHINEFNVICEFCPKFAMNEEVIYYWSTYNHYVRCKVRNIYVQCYDDKVEYSYDLKSKEVAYDGSFNKVSETNLYPLHALNEIAAINNFAISQEEIIRAIDSFKMRSTLELEYKPYQNVAPITGSGKNLLEGKIFATPCPTIKMDIIPVCDLTELVKRYVTWDITNDIQCTLIKLKRRRIDTMAAKSKITKEEFKKIWKEAAPKDHVMAAITPKSVQRNEKNGSIYTTVVWLDGTSTVVKLRAGEEDDQDKAVLYCIIEKMLTFDTESVKKNHVKGYLEFFDEVKKNNKKGEKVNEKEKA